MREGSQLQDMRRAESVTYRCFEGEAARHGARESLAWAVLAYACCHGMIILFSLSKISQLGDRLHSRPWQERIPRMVRAAPGPGG